MNNLEKAVNYFLNSSYVSLYEIIRLAMGWADERIDLDDPQDRIIARADIGNCSDSTWRRIRKNLNVIIEALESNGYDIFSGDYLTIEVVNILEDMIDGNAEDNEAYKNDENEENEEEPVAIKLAICAPRNITIQLEGEEARTIPADHPLYGEVAKLLEEGKYGEAYEKANPAQYIQERSFGRIKITKDGDVLVGDHSVGADSDSLLSRIIDAAKENNAEMLERLVKFVDKLYDNPQLSVISRIYDFIRASDIEIGEDGRLICFKKIRSDYKDVYTGTIDNSPGQIVSMPRNQVLDDDNQTCARGLHVCSWEYLAHYSGSRIIRVAVDPRDVVSIPVDYNDSKMRCCKYEVLEEITK